MARDNQLGAAALPKPPKTPPQARPVFLAFGALFVLIFAGFAVASLVSGSDDEPTFTTSESEPTRPVSGPVCATVLATYGRGEANYERAMLDNPTCLENGTSVLYYDYLDSRGITYPGWPN